MANYVHGKRRFDCYATRRKRTVGKPVSVVVAELLAVKEACGASARYLQDLRHRLNRFAVTFHKNACNGTTAEIQEWLDGQKLKPQSYQNFRRVVHLLFEFALARGYASDNPVAYTERWFAVKPEGPANVMSLPAQAHAERTERARKRH